MTRSQPLLILVLLCTIVPLSTAEVVWQVNTDDPEAWADAETRDQHALNNGLASTLRTRARLADPVEEAIAVANTALQARQQAMAGATGSPWNVAADLGRASGNLELVRAVLSTSAQMSDPDQKLFAIAEQGLASRQTALAYLGDERLPIHFAHERRNIAAARELEPLAGLPDVTEGIVAAAEAGALQAARDGITIPPSTFVCAGIGAMAAIEALAGGHGYALTVPEREEIEEALFGLSAEARAALACLIEAFIALERSIPLTDDPNEEFARDLIELFLREPERAVAIAMEATPGAGLFTGLAMDVGPALALRDEVLRAAEELALALAGTTMPCVHIVVPTSEDSPDVVDFAILSLALGGCAETHTRDVILSVDDRGNDLYANNAGGNRLGNLCDRVHRVRLPPGATAAFDFGGDDRYQGYECGVNGGAAEGFGILLDVGGNDRYEVDGGFGANGGGHAGIGLLIDSGGDDLYSALGYGANGGAFFGAGSLVDAGAGVDEYRATHAGVNGAGEHGFGFLYDGGGGDQYLVESRSANGGGFLGNGYLFDASGGDRYIAAKPANGEYATAANGGGRLGSGFLVDLEGNDHYTADQEGANGGGWFGVGALLDARGADVYTATENGTNGAGWGRPGGENFEGFDLPARIGFGLLVDVEGGDWYWGTKFATNGGCYVGGSFFVDLNGNDHYMAKDGGGANGGAGGHINGMCVAFFLDGFGDDVYDVRTDYAEARPGPYGKVEFQGGKGVNGGAGGIGAVGFLFDAGGDDWYAGGTTGVNGGAWQGVGLLVDASGNDHYLANGEGGNGGGYRGKSEAWNSGTDAAVPGAGFLVDLTGVDSYDGTQLGQNGGAYEAAGFLYDGGGLGWFNATTRGVNGGAAGSTALLYDHDGVDAYRAAAGAIAANGAAVSATRNGVAIPGMGKLVDAFGVGDTYARGCYLWRDETRIAQSTAGSSAQKDFEGVPLNLTPVLC